MVEAIREKENKIAKVKESLTRLRLSLSDIINKSEEKMTTVLKNNDEKKTQEILEELKKM